MGNQASKVIEKTKEKKEKRKVRRRSTISVSTQSQASLHFTPASPTRANYDWLETSQPPSMSSSVSTSNAPTVSSTASQQQRRRSVSDFFAKRKQSLKTTISQDEYKENDRLQRLHYLLKSARKGNFSAPIQVQGDFTILDLGCGGGIWSLEMAAQYPTARVLAVDMKAPQTLHYSPKNLECKVMDITEPWQGIPDNSIDYIFQRNMGQVIKTDKWECIFSEMYRTLKPGGLIELFEPDLYHHNPGPVQQAFDSFLKTQCDDGGVDFALAEAMPERIEKAGFSELSTRLLDLPVGEWPSDPELKQFGFINKEVQRALLKNMKTFYISHWGISGEDYDLASQEVMEEFEEYHGFSRFTSWIATKPTTA
ncbi:S-adenosyl-L-methionine-dependent methyltransferase [Umbelopsis sp. AD052]|nr:S-adenosyl-L-methionine-dependent methyltransferase [Umbelopsis sp. AD052]